MLQIKEACSCGASFEIRDVDYKTAMKSVREWRRQHVCEQGSGDGDRFTTSADLSISERSDSPYTPEMHIGFRGAEFDE
jgi:glycosyltransferase A (GT-A) superfamily protein (DUF2064 family)